MSAKGIGHNLSFWTPVRPWVDPDAMESHASFALSLKQVVGVIADGCFDWTGERATVTGPILKGLSPAVLHEIPSPWYKKVLHILTYNFFAVHYVARRYTPAVARSWVVSPILWTASLFPLAMLVTKLYCRSGHRYYVYSSEEGDIGINVAAKCTLDRLVFGEYGAVDRLPKMQEMEASEFEDRTAEQMTHPIEQYVVKHGKNRMNVIAMKLKGQQHDCMVQKLYHLHSTNKGTTWIEGNPGLFFAHQMVINNGDFNSGANLEGRQALISIAQGGKGKGSNGIEWQLAT